MEEVEAESDLWGIASSAGGLHEVKTVVAHVDLDAFYAQVERERDPTLRGKPLGVVQYNPYGDLRAVRPEEPRIVTESNGSLIAVSYEARAAGVKRVMRGDEARKACPDLVLVQVPILHGKADLTIYRDAGSRVLKVLARWCVCERASIDEAYCDLTEKATALMRDWGEAVIERARATHLAGMQEDGPVLSKEDLRNGHTGAAPDLRDRSTWWWSRPAQTWSPAERLLTCGAAVMADMRQAVLDELGYTCSAGIAPNKLLSKLASGMNKPAAQTLVLPMKVRDLLGPLPISRIKGLGGDLGARIQAECGVTSVSELWAVPMPRLEALEGQSTAQWVWRISRGMDDDPVQDRQLPKSLSCGKTFYGRNNLRSLEEVKKWLLQLASELTERLQADARDNARLPQLLTVSFQASGDQAATTQQHKRAGTAAKGDPNRWPPSQPVSRSHALHLNAEAVEHKASETQETLTDLAFSLVRKWHNQQQSAGTGKAPPLCLTTLFLTVGNFLPLSQKSLIASFFKASGSSRSTLPRTTHHPPTPQSEPSPPSGDPPPNKARQSPPPFRLELPPTPATDEDRKPAAQLDDPTTTAAQQPRPPEPATSPAPPPQASPPRTLPVRPPMGKRKRGGLDQYLKPEGPGDRHGGTPPPVAAPAAAAASGGGGGSALGGSSSSSGGMQGGASSSGAATLLLDPRDIDQSVLQELPLHIRLELTAAMKQQHKPPDKHHKKRTPAITSFFKKK